MGNGKKIKVTSKRRKSDLRQNPRVVKKIWIFKNVFNWGKMWSILWV